jgi:hypothetical protein
VEEKHSFPWLLADRLHDPGVPESDGTPLAINAGAEILTFEFQIFELGRKVGLPVSLLPIPRPGANTKVAFGVGDTKFDRAVLAPEPEPPPLPPPPLNCPEVWAG